MELEIIAKIGVRKYKKKFTFDVEQYIEKPEYADKSIDKFMHHYFVEQKGDINTNHALALLDVAKAGVNEYFIEGRNVLLIARKYTPKLEALAEENVIKYVKENHLGNIKEGLNISYSVNDINELKKEIRKKGFQKSVDDLLDKYSKETGIKSYLDSKSKNLAKR